MVVMAAGVQRTEDVTTQCAPPVVTQGAACRQYFEQKKQHLEKRDKTVAANSRALRTVEARTAAALSKAEAASSIRAARAPHWFEKFNWFVTSEGYLVVSARDAPQAEMLLRRCALCPSPVADPQLSTTPLFY